MTAGLIPFVAVLVAMLSIQAGASLVHPLFTAFGMGVSVSTLLRLVISTSILLAIYRPNFKSFLIEIRVT